MTVLSPPGSTSPASPSRSFLPRISTVSAPHLSIALICSRNAPCSARTPIRGCSLPAPFLHALFRSDGGYFKSRMASPRSRETSASTL